MDGNVLGSHWENLIVSFWSALCLQARCYKLIHQGGIVRVAIGWIYEAQTRRTYLIHARVAF
jgi:hypothetical protein